MKKIIPLAIFAGAAYYIYNNSNKAYYVKINGNTAEAIEISNSPEDLTAVDIPEYPRIETDSPFIYPTNSTEISPYLSDLPIYKDKDRKHKKLVKFIQTHHVFLFVGDLVILITALIYLGIKLEIRKYL